MNDLDLIEVIKAVEWLLQRDSGAISLMYKKQLQSIKERMKAEVNAHDDVVNSLPAGEYGSDN